ncbi:tyrosine-type recombinase/integrase, partial [Alphaproteobacteria bacterium]|nr:tyrosine-type recombinase/integrase [Alphaproteobacteria bacterium]
SFSLRTKSNAGALRAAQSVTQRLEDYWLGLRLQDMDIPAIHLVKANHVDDSSPLMLDAVENYLRIKGNDDRIFIRTAQRNGSYVAKLLGNRPITSYATSEAAQFRDWCLDKGMNINSVKRVFASVRSIINLNIREYGLDGTNAFSGTYMPDGFDTPKRKPIPDEILKVIQSKCQVTDDEPRWLVALISDTGMRLSEAAGLSKGDVYLDEEVPYVDIKPHPWRRLKTAGSKRKVPLVGVSLWAARQAYAASNSPFLFPRYCDEKECHSNSASAALNKWLKQVAGPDYVIHSFRHSMRDRLRAVNCPSDMIDQIGGWSSGKVGEGYGDGYSLNALCNLTRDIIHLN